GVGRWGCPVHVFGRDPAAGAAAPDLSQVDAELPCQLPDRRRCEHWRAFRARRRGRPGLIAPRFGSRRGDTDLSSGFEDVEDRAGLDGFALGGALLDHYARAWGGKLD